MDGRLSAEEKDEACPPQLPQMDSANTFSWGQVRIIDPFTGYRENIEGFPLPEREWV